MGKPHIEVYFDLVSPFSYLGFWAMEELHPFKSIEKKYVPILLGGLMKACNNVAPIQIQNKGLWINIERLRWSSLFNIPMTTAMPPGFPPNTITAQRAMVALASGSHHCCVNKAAMALFQAFWVDHKDLADPNVLVEVLSRKEVLGPDTTKEIMAQVGDKAIKDKLTANTKEAFDAGSFGLPWFIVTNDKGETESFWGFDHLGQVADFLGLEKPKSGGWRAVL